MSKANDTPPEPLVITRSDVGRHVFRYPEDLTVDPKECLKSPNLRVDTEGVIVADDHGRLGFVFIRGPQIEHSNCVNSVYAWLIDQNNGRVYATQSDAIRAAIAVEKEYAEDVLRVCNAMLAEVCEPPNDEGEG